MPSKKKESKSGQQSASWEKPDDVLQAVILTDSFNYRFLPITLEKPRVGILLFARGTIFIISLQCK